MKAFPWEGENVFSCPRGWLSTFQALLISYLDLGLASPASPTPTRYRKQTPTWLSSLVPTR